MLSKLVLDKYIKNLLKDVCENPWSQGSDPVWEEKGKKQLLLLTFSKDKIKAEWCSFIANSSNLGCFL